MRYLNTDKSVRGLVIPVAALTMIGILMVYSSSVFISADRYGSSYHFLGRHFFTVLIGFLAMIMLSRFNYHKLRFFAIPLLVFSAILLILVFVPGIGASAGPQSEVKRWIKLWPSTFQPVELVKITMIIFLADYIDRKSVV